MDFAEGKQVKARKITSYQQTLGIRRIDCNTNEEVLRRVGEIRKLLALLAERRNTKWKKTHSQV